LLSVEGDSAWVDIDGRRVKLRIGENVALAAQRSRAQRACGRPPQRRSRRATSCRTAPSTVTPVRFLLDTGATVIALGRADARRANINTSAAASGRDRADRQRRCAGLAGPAQQREARQRHRECNVEAAVMETDMPHVLLGMSFPQPHGHAAQRADHDA
jgi:aspartyl protease family protein